MPRDDTIYLIDYGLSKRYRDVSTKKHHQYCENKKFLGTARYASVNTHLGIEQSRRDDIESLAYMLIYFIDGSLPWQGIKVSQMKSKNNAIMKKKIECSIDKLCTNAPDSIRFILQHSKALHFDETPQYDTLIEKLKSDIGIYSPGYITFDWLLVSALISQGKNQAI